MDFEVFLTNRNDEIDNAAFQLIILLSNKACVWDMELIGDVVDAVLEELRRHGVSSCYPYYEGDESVPCFQGTDCKNPNCPLKRTD